MKEAVILVALLVSSLTASVAGNPTNEGDEARLAFYTQELHTLVAQAPTVYAQNVATHYLKIVQASEALGDLQYRLSSQDIETLDQAFGSAPTSLKVVKQLQVGTK